MKEERIQLMTPPIAAGDETVVGFWGTFWRSYHFYS